MSRTDAGTLVVRNAAIRIEIILQGINVLVVNLLHAVSAEETLLALIWSFNNHSFVLERNIIGINIFFGVLNRFRLILGRSLARLDLAIDRRTTRRRT